MLGLQTCMRRGEAKGLIWKYVDLDNYRLYVFQQYASDKTFRAPKSETSKRWISFDEDMGNYLKKWKARQQGIFSEINRKMLEKHEYLFDKPDELELLEQNEDTLVISNEIGSFSDPNNFSRWFRDFCVKNEFDHFGEREGYYDSQGIKRYRKAKYEGLKFHELRHTQATLLIGNGMDFKTVQHRLGHSSALLTMNIYAHAIPQNDADTANTIGALLRNAG